MRPLIVFCLALALNSTLCARDYSTVFARVNPAVVVITTHAAQARENRRGPRHLATTALGSGVVISDDGLVMTASHVVHSADDVIVRLADGQTYPASVASSAALADVALIKIHNPPEDLAFVELSDSDDVAIGAEVFVIGAPHDRTHTLSVGHLSGRRIIDGENALMDLEYLQTDAALNAGNAGGPLFTAEGELIGIVSHRVSLSDGKKGLGFAASSNMARRLLIDEIPIWFGVEFIPLRGHLAEAFNIPFLEGLLVERVAKRSFGSMLGLRAGTIPIQLGDYELLIGGDIIVEVGGHRVNVSRRGRERIQNYLNDKDSGDTIRVTVIRGGKLLELAADKP